MPLKLVFAPWRKASRGINAIFMSSSLGKQQLQGCNRERDKPISPSTTNLKYSLHMASCDASSFTSCGSQFHE